MKTAAEILAEIKSPARKRVIIDTDAYNEIDDQFAIAYALLSESAPGSAIEVLSICAAPFYNSRSSSPGDGMDKSYAEIFNVMDKLRRSYGGLIKDDIPVYRGSGEIMRDAKTPVPSEAAEQIIRAAFEHESVYIIALGAITNVASALLSAPEIKEKLTVVWLGGHAHHWPHTREFNLRGDVCASQAVFDSGVNLVQIPCAGVCSELITTIPELEHYLGGQNEICDYLVDIVRGYTNDPWGWSKVIWDISAVACLTLPKSADLAVIPRPVITDGCRYAFDSARPHMIYTRSLRRDMIFANLFNVLKQVKKQQ